MEQELTLTRHCENLWAERGSGGSLQAEFPHLNLVHEIEIRGSCDWNTLAEASLCLQRFGAQPVSVSARRYHEKAQSITCRIRSREERALNAALAELKRLRGVSNVSLSHYLGRASRESAESK